ncbi:MAG: hypothetical protein J0I14_10660 [Propionibacteriaceae bacterium]|nr:hypothetical protein [Propionibacteriaceae bacterium]
MDTPKRPQGPTRAIIADLEHAVAAGDTETAVEALGRYSRAALAGEVPLLTSRPNLPWRWVVLVASVSNWVAIQRGEYFPIWTEAIASLPKVWVVVQDGQAVDADQARREWAETPSTIKLANIAISESHLH